MAAPTVKFAQFSSSGQNPSGSRHLTSHGSYIKELNGSASGTLDFGSLNIDGAINHSPTKALIFRVSNMNANTRVENMRFWAPILPSIAGEVYFNFKTLQSYISGIALTNASGAVPTSLPTSQNITRTDGHASLSGITDSEVSRWIYLNVTATSDTTTGKYGGNSSFLYRMTYDYV